MREPRPALLSASETAKHREAMSGLRTLLNQGVIREAGAMLRHWQCCLVLADLDGVIVERWGDARLLPGERRSWLEPGASWDMEHCGCNAINTCLGDGEAVAVLGQEHACPELQHLASFAVPLKTPQGCIDACLALISDPYRDRSHHYSGLLQVLSMQIENRRLINHYRRNHYRLTFNFNLNDLESPRSGLLILDSRGRLEAGNSRARWLLGLDTERDRGRPFESLCNGQWRDLLDRYGSLDRHDSPVTLRFVGRYQCCCRLDGPTALPVTHEATGALQRLDLGDPQLHQSILLASRLKDRGVCILIRGETGSGKEVFVRALHASSVRADRPLVAINCAAIPADLVEAELFGYVRGAFTGADPRGSIGRLREADGGRLFLDEIGDMPLSVQARLLRVLQERCVTPLGGGETYPIDIEVIAATHRPLAQEVASGRFRADLYYRLCGVELRLPPLRERQDKRELIDTLLTTLESRMPPHTHRTTATPSPELMQWLCEQPWPGNIRELENILRVALAMADGPLLSLDHLPAHLTATPSVTTPSATTLPTSFTQRLAEHHGNLSSLARELRISRTTLYKRLRAEREAIRLTSPPDRSLNAER